MQDFRIATRIIILSLILLCGCSNGYSTPVGPGNSLDGSLTGVSGAQITSGTSDSGTHVPWGIFDLAFDPATNEMRAIENREILGHFNITAFMQPPNCSNCLVFHVLGVEFKIFHLEATIYNPFPKISGYDPRLIMDAGVSGYELSDPDTGLPDGYTELWNTWGETCNPFIAYAKDQPQRKVLPLSSHVRQFDLSYTDVTGGFKMHDIRIIIDACAPINCPEPYEITDIELGAAEIPEYGTSVPISCGVRTWSPNTIDAVTVTLSDVGDPLPFFTTDLQSAGGDLYSGNIELSGQRPPGTYQMWIRTLPKADTNPDAYMWQMNYITISKVQTGGDFEWARTWGGISSDIGTGVAIDDSGNTYITGFFNGTVDFDPSNGEDWHTAAGYSDIFLSKFDSTGNFKWAKTWGGSYEETSKSVAVDLSGDVYVTGWFFGTTDFDPGNGVENHTSKGFEDIFLSKFDSSGNFKWAKTWGSSSYFDEGFGIAADALGNVYVTGDFMETVDFDPGNGEDWQTSNGHSDVFLSKFDSAGNYIWVRTWGAYDWDDGFGVTVDVSGNVYVTGDYSLTVDFDPSSNVDNHTSKGWDAFLSKFDSSGNFKWAETWGGDSSYGDGGYGVATDALDNPYVTGIFAETVDFDPGSGVDNHKSNGYYDIFLSKFDSAGNFMWANTWGGNDIVYGDRGYGVAVDESSNAYVTGLFEQIVDFDPSSGVENHTSNGYYDIFLSKFDSAGNFIWAKTWGSSDTDNGDGGYGVAVDISGNAYVSGSFYATVDFDPGNGEDWHTSGGSADVFLSKFSG